MPTRPYLGDLSMRYRFCSRRLLAAALLPAAMALATLTGCTSSLGQKTTAELRAQLMQTYRDQLPPSAGEPIELGRDDSEFEQSLARVLERAQAEGINVPEDRRDVAGNLAAADADSGAQAYRDTPLEFGDSLAGGETPKVTLGLEAALARAVEHNLDLAVARLSPQISEQQIIQAEAIFDSVLFANADWTKTDTPRPPGTIPGLSGDQQAETFTMQTGIRKQFDTGAELLVQAQGQYLEQTPSLFGVTSYYDTDLLVQLTQPLLRGFGQDVNRANIELATIARDADRASLRSTMIDVVTAVEQTYWQLVGAQQALLIEQRLLERTIAMRDKLEPRFGFDLLLADLNEVNAQVDARRADVLRSRDQVRSLSDQLKRLINDPELPVSDETLIVTADAALDQPITFSLLDQITTALQHRPELETALLQIDDIDIRLRVADNARLPILNLVASANANGLDVEEPFTARANALDLDYIDYVLGVQFEQPLGNNSAEALFTQRTLERQQALTNYRRQAQDVTVEVKDALRSVDTNYRLIETTRSQRRASALSLEVAAVQLDEGGRNEAETFTTRVDRVLARQDALAQAEQAEVQALTDYMIAISELNRANGTALKRAGVMVEEGE
ncbi:MAG: TolC family protein [Planctomycetota bacterium]